MEKNKSPPPSLSTSAPVGSPCHHPRIKLSVACLITDLLLAALFFSASLPHSSLGVSRDHLLKQPLALWPFSQSLLGNPHKDPVCRGRWTYWQAWRAPQEVQLASSYNPSDELSVWHSESSSWRGDIGKGALILLFTVQGRGFAV